MRAAVIGELGRPPELTDRPEPCGGAIYEVSAVALNPIDVNVGAGRFFGGHPELPYIPGCEGVGRAPNGTRVYLFGDGLGLSRDGLLAERAVAPAGLGIPLPDVVSDGIAAACGIAGMAGWMPVAWRAPVRKDDRVLVLGALARSGSSPCRRRSCSAPSASWRRVAIASVSRARWSSGPTRPSVSTRTTLPEPSRRRPAAAVRPTSWTRCGGTPAAAALQAAAPGWRLVQIGQSAAPEVPLASAVIRGKMGEIYGFLDFAVPAKEFREHYLRLVGHAAAGDVVFDLATYAVDRIAEAWQRQANGPNAKIVVTMP